MVAGVALLAYLAFVRLVERRAASELAAGPAPAEVGLGLVIGALLFAATIGFISLLGYYHIELFNSWAVAIPALADLLVAGVFEEILFRGLLFRITQSCWAPGWRCSSPRWCLACCIWPTRTPRSWLGWPSRSKPA